VSELSHVVFTIHIRMVPWNPSSLEQTCSTPHGWTCSAAGDRTRECEVCVSFSFFFPLLHWDGDFWALTRSRCQVVFLKRGGHHVTWVATGAVPGTRPVFLRRWGRCGPPHQWRTSADLQACTSQALHQFLWWCHASTSPMRWWYDSVTGQKKKEKREDRTDFWGQWTAAANTMKGGQGAIWAIPPYQHQGRPLCDVGLSNSFCSGWIRGPACPCTGHRTQLCS